MVGNRPVMRPRQQFARHVRAQQVRFRHDPYATKVQAIGIPTRQECRIAIGVSIGVQPTRLVQQVEASVVEVHQRTTHRAREIPAARAMSMVAMLVHAACIMKQREQSYDLGIGAVRLRHAQSVFLHARPMHDAVIAANREYIFLKNRLQNP